MFSKDPRKCINLLAVQKYLVQKENAEPIDLTDIELRSIQRRVILNCYLDVVLENLLQQSEYRGFSKKETQIASSSWTPSGRKLVSS